MKTNLPQELDFSIEAKNAINMRRIFKDQVQIKVPEIYEEFSCDKVLTMEFIQGGNVDDLNEIKKQNLSPSDVSYLLGDCFAQQIFKYGVVHADPHSGNVFVRQLPRENYTLWQKI